MVFNAQPSNVEWVLWMGASLRRGQLVEADAEAVLADANRAAQRVSTALLR